MGKSLFLGLDLGTSGLKALLLDNRGKTIATGDRTYPVSHPLTGWSEQDPADWVHACNEVLTELAGSHPDEMADVKGIGVSGQMHGATVLGKDRQVIRPCILWNDVRSHVQAARLDGIPEFREISGNIVFPGFTAPKLVWMAENEPDLFSAVDMVLLPKDYLNFWLTGICASDMSDSAGTSWLDVGARDWSDELLSKSGMRRDQMPDLHEGCNVIGALKPELATQWGIDGKVAVVGGGGDNAAAACGLGTLREGDGFVSLGTSGVLLAGKEQFSPMPSSAVHTFCHAVPGRWYQMGVILAATDSLNWLSRNLGRDPQNLSEELGETISGPGQMQFLPYLSGERTPHNDSEIRGAFLNIDISSGQAEMTQAVLEGVSFALRDSLEALKSTGTSLNRVLATGGGSQSPYWVELLATVLNIPIDLPEKGEFGAALGAARLAMIGVTGANPDDIMTQPRIANTISPRRDLVATYEVAYQSWRTIYPAVKVLT
ncbi:xylulokinase [Aliiroseovarius subalbicans]|uniref:xylulokinase n=1 Tax=Aliiroseovarius subalbicans TaxID=2925840 RepID=UPI001F587771|nr:xylulokinase [Aliiroseovarius subalbicans]MCI2400837.1 xylulokinase [Aliiroseovarius subalbicans]